jgi:hypothetical protein
MQNYPARKYVSEPFIAFMKDKKYVSELFSSISLEGKKKSGNGQVISAETTYICTEQRPITPHIDIVPSTNTRST